MLLNCSLSAACIVTFLIQPRPTCLSMASSAAGCALLDQLLIKKLFHRHAQRPICGGNSSVESPAFQVSQFGVSCCHKSLTKTTLSQLTLPSHSPPSREAETMDEYFLLAYFSYALLSQDSMPRSSTPQVDWAPPLSITNKENALQANLMETIAQLRFPLSK